MCGIAGVLGATDERVIRAMTESLVHRGPDGKGIWTDGQAALGHTRLSIIDVEGGAQPIANADESVMLVCNGEIYNSVELRDHYLRQGYRFRTRTDVEVILPLYEEHGERCTEYLRGMFAFAIWDRRASTLLLARDHMGQKPLYYATAGSRFLFGSEPKALLASGLLANDMDLDAMWHYMSLRYIPDDRSLFQGVKKLEAAHSLAYQLGTGRTTTRRYWQPEFEPKYAATESALIDQLDEIMREAVSAHLLSDVPVGAFLSGGIDSGTVSAMMASSVAEPFPTFTIGVEDAGFDETGYARQVVERYGLNGHFRQTAPDLVDLAPAMIRAMDEPSDPFGAGVYLVSGLAREHVKVVLTGDGGDESYAGYDRYSGQRLTDLYCLLPEAIRRNVFSRLFKLIPESFAYKSMAQKLLWLDSMSQFSKGRRYANSLGFLRFTHERKLDLWTESARARLEQADSAERALKYFDAASVPELVDKMLYTDMMTRLPDHLLAISDRMSMAHSLEARPVLVDRRFVEFSARVPTRYKLKGTTLKYLLRKVAERYLPRELVYREKQGFSFPIGRWIRGDLRHLTRGLLCNSRLAERGILERGELLRLFDEHVQGRADHTYRLWMLVNFELWHRMYFEGASVESVRELTRSMRDQRALA